MRVLTNKDIPFRNNENVHLFPASEAGLTSDNDTLLAHCRYLTLVKASTYLFPIIVEKKEKSWTNSLVIIEIKHVSYNLHGEKFCFNVRQTRKYEEKVLIKL
jgi:hypothetical protein